MPLSFRRRDPPVSNTACPDHNLRTCFPTLHPLIRLMRYRTAGEYVASLNGDGHQAQPLSRSHPLIDAITSITGYDASSLPVLFQIQARDQGHVIETDAARYIYKTSPTGEICSLRVMSKAEDDNGPYALFLQEEDEVTVMEICDPTAKKQFVEYRKPDGSIRSTLYVVGQPKDLSEVYSGRAYYLREENSHEDPLILVICEDEGPESHS